MTARPADDRSIPSRYDLELKLSELQQSFMLDPAERLQLPRIKAMLDSPDDSDQEIAASAMKALRIRVEERKQRRRADAGAVPSVNAAASSLESERKGAHRVVHVLLWTIGIIIVGGATGFVFMAMSLLGQVDSGFLLAGALLVALWVLLCVYLGHTAARLFQLAREWAEKMDVRSVSVRFLSEAIAHYEATGDPALLDTARDMMPPANTNVDARPIDTSDLRAGLDSVVRMTKSIGRKNTKSSDESAGGLTG